MSEPTLDAATEAAVGWLVTLNSGSVSAAERQDFETWLSIHTSHRAAWERLAGPLAQMLAPARERQAGAGGWLGGVLAHADGRARQRRRLLRGALGLGGVASGAALLLADRQTPLAQLGADLRTGTGERRDFTLPDGSRLTLDARSAVDIDFGPGRRNLTLRQGALLAQVAPISSSQPAPFTVRNLHGQVRALGTQFVLRQGSEDSLVGMLEHSVEITAANGQRMELPQGQSARFGPDGIRPVDLPPSAASAWQQGMLEAHDQPLGEVVQALRAYRGGFIRVAPRAAALRVYGSYALDDSDRALQAIGETLPVTVRIYQHGWLTTIE